MDAVGVTESMKTAKPIDGSPTTKTITLKELLERISHGYIPDEYLKRLAATLARIYYKADESQKKEFARLSHHDMKELSAKIYAVLEKAHSLRLLVQTILITSVRDWYPLLPIMPTHEDIYSFLLPGLSIR